MTANFDYTEFGDIAAGLWADLGDTYPGTCSEADVVRRLRDHLNTYPRIDDNQPADTDLWKLRAAYIDALARIGLGADIDKDTP